MAKSLPDPLEELRLEMAVPPEIFVDGRTIELEDQRRRDLQQLVASQSSEDQPLFRRCPPFAPQLRPPLGGEPSEEIVEGGIAGVAPLVLDSEPGSEAERFERGPLELGAKQNVNRRELFRPRVFDRRPDQLALAGRAVLAWSDENPLAGFRP